MTDVVKFTKVMESWAVVEAGGKQYKVKEGQILIVEKVNTSKDQISLSQVLLNKKDDKLVIGKPLVEGAKVKVKVLGNFGDKKIKVVKFKSKSRYLRVRGHRQAKTKVLIEKIIV